MKYLRHALAALAASALLCAGACSGDETASSDEQNVFEVDAKLMAAAPEAPGQIRVLRDSGGQWLFHATGQQGEAVLLSQTYQAKASALNGILSVKENGVLLDSYEVTDLGGDFSFVLRAGNGQVIADGARFGTQSDAELGIADARDLVAGLVQYDAAMTDGARFDLWRDQTDREWYFVLRAEDGRTLLESESYQRRTGALNGIESVRTNGKDPNRYEVVDATLVLYASNGQDIGSSVHDSAAAAQAARDELVALLVSERVANPW